MSNVSTPPDVEFSHYIEERISRINNSPLKRWYRFALHNLLKEYTLEGLKTAPAGAILKYRNAGRKFLEGLEEAGLWERLPGYNKDMKIIEKELPKQDSNRIPTHKCKVCGGLWRLWDARDLPRGSLPSGEEGCWTLVTQNCGKCCDNEFMGDQIVLLTLGELEKYLNGGWIVDPEAGSKEEGFQGIELIPAMKLAYKGNSSNPRHVSRDEFYRLKESGMLWEFYPDAPEEFPDHD